MNVLDELSFSVALRELERRAQLPGNVVKPALDIIQRLRAIHGRLTHPEQIEVRTVDDRDPHVFFSPSSHALNC